VLPDPGGGGLATLGDLVLGRTLVRLDGGDQHLGGGAGGDHSTHGCGANGHGPYSAAMRAGAGAGWYRFTKSGRGVRWKPSP
jgi:hypothetical protein